MSNPAKPVSLLKLEGTYRPDRHSKLCEDPAKKGFPVAPTDLSPIARKKWDEIAAQDIDIIRELDASILEVYCELWAEFKMGEMNTSRLGLMAKIGQSLFLDPAARVKIQSTKDDKPKGGFSDF